METQIRVMQKLSIYKFLTLIQLQLLGWEQSKKSLYKTIQALREKGFIQTITYSYHPKFGRVEDMHFLKPKSILYLKDHLGLPIENIKLPINHKGFFEDYEHRKMCVRLQMEIDLNLRKAFKVIFFEQYFENIKRVNSRHRETATKINLGENYIIPDFNFVVQYNNTPTLFCGELHNGYRVLRVEKKIKMYVELLAKGSASEKYNIQSNPYVLNVFEKECTLQTTLERLTSDSYYKYLKRYILFISYKDFIQDSFGNRKDLTNKKIDLNYIIETKNN